MEDTLYKRRFSLDFCSSLQRFRRECTLEQRPPFWSS